MPGDTPFYAKNGLIANTLFTANATNVNLGANVLVIPTSITVQNTTSNVVVNAGTIFIGNSTINVTINSTSLGAIGTNVNATYTWSNLHTFTNTITFSGVVNQSGNTASQTLTDAATINWNIALGQIATVTLAGNRTVAAPTNLTVGTYILHIIQDATGSRTLTWNAVFKWALATAPVLTTTAARHDIISFICDGTNLYGSFLPDVR